MAPVAAGGATVVVGLVGITINVVGRGVAVVEGFADEAGLEALVVGLAA